MTKSALLVAVNLLAAGGFGAAMHSAQAVGPHTTAASSSTGSLPANGTDWP